MTVGDYVFPLMTALFFSSSLGHSHRRAIETNYVSVGHFFQLKCGITESHTNVTWSRGGNNTSSLPSGVEFREGDLWFLPVKSSHNGAYTCKSRDKSRSWEMEFDVLVSSGRCPGPVENRSITEGTSNTMPCKQDHLLKLDNTAHFHWLKDCSPVERHREAISIDQYGHIRLPAASESDAGVYTCLVDFTLDGRNYTAARSIRLKIDHDPVLYPPIIAYPKQDTRVVELGSRVELRCLAYFGFSEVMENLMYWTVNGSLSDNHKQFTYSVDYIHQENNEVRGLSILSISEVLPEFLDVPIRCHVMNPTAQDEGLVRLQKADHSVFYTCLTLSLAFPVVILAVATAVLFKVDLVLIYRKLRRRLTKQRISDGKLYDAYVSYLHGDGVSSPEAATFALQVLPEVLERQHGYRLYVRGRDDCPGEAMHDAIAEMVRQSRRLIIVLSAPTKSSTDHKMEEALSLQHSRNQLGYEQRIGLYDALTQNESCVILVETDGLVDYGSLPESLRYIKKKQGALRWRTTSGNRNPSRLLHNGHFWKCLRYHMPPVPGGTPLTVV